eukprot:GHUV01007382.1.p1 GENE.GHUV01007382.1~~GHUV01007382.1.p1  ORF type:complete len:195 (+),score=51.74 GHUV01007382.1:153-737(+)
MMLRHTERICSPISSFPSAQPSTPVLVRSGRQAAVRCCSQQQGLHQAEQQHGSNTISRRGTFVQLSSAAVLGSLSVFLSGITSTPTVPAAAAAAGPRQLDEETKAAVNQALSKVITKPKAPVILRLAYHDAGTYSAAAGNGGANASIQFELDRPENTGLKRGWNLIGQVSLLPQLRAGRRAPALPTAACCTAGA